MIPALYRLSTSSSLELPEQRHAILEAEDGDPLANVAESECSSALSEKPDSNLRIFRVLE